jgi:hypothetical protein
MMIAKREGFVKAKMFCGSDVRGLSYLFFRYPPGQNNANSHMIR